MFWKKFRSALSAGKLFNQANGHWRRRQRFLLAGDDEGARQACIELVRLCQLAIQGDERMGDAYVLLANALTVAASHSPRHSDEERYEFLQSRAAAVIHLWYTLPHRGYPITKKTGTEIGERLWRIMVDDISQDKSLSKDAAIALIESYRDSLAAETTSPGSFEKIRGMILRTASTPEPNRWKLREPLEQTLPPEIWDFLVKILHKAEERESHKEQVTTERFSHIQAQLDKLRDFVDDNPPIFHAKMEVLDRFKQAYDENDFRQAIGWLTWLNIVEIHRESIIPDSASKEDIAKHWKPLIEMLRTTTNKAREAEEWDTLLLAVGFCEWVGLSEWGDEILRVMYDRIGKQGVESRLRHIDRQPRMLAEGRLVHCLQRHLAKS